MSYDLANNLLFSNTGIAQCVSMDAIVKHATYHLEMVMADMKMQTEKVRLEFGGAPFGV